MKKRSRVAIEDCPDAEEACLVVLVLADDGVELLALAEAGQRVVELCELEESGAGLCCAACRRRGA